MRGGSYILMGVPGTELDAATAAIMRQVQPAGFILFGRNIKTAPQLRKLIDDLRVSPRGDRVAFVKHPVPMDDGGAVVLAAPAGRARVLSAGWESIEGLA